MNLTLGRPIFTRPLINIGALIDIPTGAYITGAKGEKILNGGLSGIEGIVGMGNNFKSTIAHYMMLSATNRMNASKIQSSMHTYDTEDNMGMNLDRLNKLSERMKWIPAEPLYDDKTWSVIPKSLLTAEEWVKKLYELVEKKIQDKSQLVKYTSFVDRSTQENMTAPKPNFIEIDSFSEFEGLATIKAVEKDIENTNTVFMQQGLFKTKVLKDLPRLSNTGNMNFILTAHLGKEINMASGPFAPQPKKALSYLKTGDKIKGVSDKLYFLTTHLWMAYGSRPLINQNTKEPEFPLEPGDVGTDLNTVNLLQLRSKSGPSGFILELIVSQREGVLPTLTEFNFLKNEKFGIGGNPRSYWIELYPDVKLSRTTVRKKIDNDEKLRRAINITAELRQMMKYMPQYKDLYCTPEELYNDIKEMGYDWDELLSTRGWWTIDQYSKDLPPYMSTLDLLLLRKMNKKLYWMKNKGKQNEKEN